MARKGRDALCITEREITVALACSLKFSRNHKDWYFDYEQFTKTLRSRGYELKLRRNYADNVAGSQLQEREPGLSDKV